MSVIRRPGLQGRRTRRVDELLAATSTAAVDAFAVGTWYALVVLESRTTFTALAGLGVLVFGALLRIGFFEAAVDTVSPLSTLERLGSAISYASCWLCWLLVAEFVDGGAALLVAGVVLFGLLTLQFALERRTVRTPRLQWFGSVRSRSISVDHVVPAVVVSFGATIVLSVTWFGEWVGESAIAVPLGARTLVVELWPILLGFFVLGLCSFLAHERRIRRSTAG